MNMKQYTVLAILLTALPALAPAQAAPSQAGESQHAIDLRSTKLYQDSRPWTRWWWFASVISKADIADNLAWLKQNGFGGVEIAWIYPLNKREKDTAHYTPRQKWLSPEWTEMVAYAKQHADELGLGCDFTFGSLWPFGDTEVPFNEATMNMIDPKWRQDLTGTWDWPKKGYVIDHLNRNAFLPLRRQNRQRLAAGAEGFALWSVLRLLGSRNEAPDDAGIRRAIPRALRLFVARLHRQPLRQ
jgi:hypothetical protein